MNREFLTISLLALTSFAAPASASCPTFHQLQNGQNADANQVMDNFNYILNCPNFTGNVGIGTTVPGTHLSLGATGGGPTLFTYEAGATVRGFANDLSNLGGWEFDIFAPDSGLGYGGTVIGKMSSDGNRTFTPYLTVRNTGQVGIGTTSPGATLDIHGTQGSVPAMGVQVTTPDFPQYIFNATNGGPNAKIWRMIGRGYNDFEIQTLNDGYGGEVTAMQIIRSGTTVSSVSFPNGAVGIGTTSPAYTLDVNGTVRAANISPTSDRRLKRDIEPLALDALAKLEQLQPVTFRWIAAKDDGMKGLQIGFVAQDVEKILPSTVTTAGDKAGTKGIKYNEITVLLVKALQDEHALVRRQAKQIADLTARLDRLEKTRMARAQ